MKNSFRYFTSRFHQSASFIRPLFFRVCCAALQISTARWRGILNITHSPTIIFLYTVTPSTRIHEFLAFAAFSKDYICLISFIYNIKGLSLESTAWQTKLYLLWPDPICRTAIMTMTTKTRWYSFILALILWLIHKSFFRDIRMKISPCWLM